MHWVCSERSLSVKSVGIEPTLLRSAKSMRILLRTKAKYALDWTKAFSTLLTFEQDILQEGFRVQEDIRRSQPSRRPTQIWWKNDLNLQPKKWREIDKEVKTHPMVCKTHIFVTKKPMNFLPKCKLLPRPTAAPPCLRPRCPSPFGTPREFWFAIRAREVSKFRIIKHIQCTKCN